MSGSVIIGYPGIGKTTLSGTYKFIDLESNNFTDSQGNHIDNWYIAYIKVAKSLAYLGYSVFISSHSDVYKQFDDVEINSLKRDGISVYAVYPSCNLRNKWIDKLHVRYDGDPCKKNLAAYVRAQTYYQSDITELSHFAKVIGIKTIELNNMDYNLRYELLRAIDGLHIDDE